MIPDVYRYSQRLDGLMSTPPPTTWDGRSRSWGWQRPTSGWAPYRYEEIHLRDRLQAPTAAYLLGTDHVGRDLLSRLIHGARLSLTVGLAATVLTVVVAVLIGGTTGFIGGRLDLVTQRFVDAWMAFPGLLLLLTIMSIAGRGMLQIIVVLGVSGGIPASRVVRGAVLGVKENAYFQAAQAIGSSRRRSLLRHVLPNIAAPIIIIFSINVGGVIMSEAALSFLGFGLPPDIPSWGGMLSREGAVHGDCAAPGTVAGAVPDRGSLQPQHVRRRRARPAGPPPARPPRPLRRRPGRIVADAEARSHVRRPRRPGDTDGTAKRDGQAAVLAAGSGRAPRHDHVLCRYARRGLYSDKRAYP